MLYLLRAIAVPHDQRAVMKALLTRFFPTSPEELFGVTELPGTHPLKACFLAWHQLAQRRASAATLSRHLHQHRRAGA